MSVPSTWLMAQARATRALSGGMYSDYRAALRCFISATLTDCTGSQLRASKVQGEGQLYSSAGIQHTCEAVTELTEHNSHTNSSKNSIMQASLCVSC